MNEHRELFKSDNSLISSDFFSVQKVHGGYAVNFSMSLMVKVDFSFS